MAIGIHNSDQGTDFSRILALSDGIFAIAMTLLVMDIKAPVAQMVADDSHVLAAIGEEIPRIISFAISFFVIGLYWITHHRYLKSLQKYDLGLLWWNLGFLFLIAFHPYPSSVVGKFGNLASAWAFYAGNLAMIGLVLSGIWRYAVRRGLVREDVDPHFLRYLKVRSLSVTAMFVCSALLGFWNVTAARSSLMLVPLAVRAINWSQRKKGATPSS